MFNLVAHLPPLFLKIRLTFTSMCFPTEQIHWSLDGGLKLVWITIDVFYFRLLFVSAADIPQVKISLGWCVGVGRSVILLAGCWEVCLLGACCGACKNLEQVWFLTAALPAAHFLPSAVGASLRGGLYSNDQYLLHD